MFRRVLFRSVASEDAFSRSQITHFDAFSDGLEKQLGYGFIRHIVNSEGILRFPNAQYDMVRLGIGLYGVARGETSAALQTVGTLKTTISQKIGRASCRERVCQYV